MSSASISSAEPLHHHNLTSGVDKAHDRDTRQHAGMSDQASMTNNPCKVPDYLSSECSTNLTAHIRAVWKYFVWSSAPEIFISGGRIISNARHRTARCKMQRAACKRQQSRKTNHLQDGLPSFYSRHTSHPTRTRSATPGDHMLAAAALRLRPSRREAPSG